MATNTLMSQIPSLVQVGSPTAPGVAGQMIWLPDLDTSNAVATPTGWAKLSTSATTTITNAQTLYPQLWARYTSTSNTSPVYRSSSDLICQVVNGFPRRTKEITLTVTSAQAGWSTTRAIGTIYSDSAGVWKLNFNIKGTFNPASVTAVSATISNVTFKNVSNLYQPISACFLNSATFNQAYVAPNTGDIALLVVSAITTTSVMFSGDVELDSEPTTYTTAANMETPKMTPFIKLYDDAGAITMSGSPFTGSNFSEQFITQTGDFTAEVDKSYVINKATAVAVTLPAMVLDKVITFKNIGAGVVTITRAGSDTIDGATSITLSQYQAIKIKGFNTNLWGVY
jgi:hypothetical protein